MNNPYKYVDRGGNTTFHEMTYGTKPKPASTKTTKKNTTVYPPHSYQGWSDLNSKKPKKPSKPKPPKGNSNGDKGKTNDRPSKTEDEFKEELEAMKALIAPDPEPCPDIDLRETKWNTFFGTYQKVNKMKFNVEVYKHEIFATQKVMLVGNSNNPNYRALWIARQSYMAASTIIDFIKAMMSLGVSELTSKTITTMAKEYGDIVVGTIKEEETTRLREDIFENNTKKEDLIFSFFHLITNYKYSKIYVFLEEQDRYRAFGNHLGLKKLINTQYDARLYVRDYGLKKDALPMLDNKDKKYYQEVNLLNSFTNYDFARDSALKYSSNINSSEFKQPYLGDTKEKLVKSYLVYV